MVGMLSRLFSLFNDTLSSSHSSSRLQPPFDDPTSLKRNKRRFESWLDMSQRLNVDAIMSADDCLRMANFVATARTAR